MKMSWRERQGLAMSEINRYMATNNLKESEFGIALTYVQRIHPELFHGPERDVDIDMPAFQLATIYGELNDKREKEYKNLENEIAQKLAIKRKWNMKNLQNHKTAIMDAQLYLAENGISFSLLSPEPVRNHRLTGGIHLSAQKGIDERISGNIDQFVKEEMSIMHEIVQQDNRIA